VKRKRERSCVMSERMYYQMGGANDFRRSRVLDACYSCTAFYNSSDKKL